MSRLIATVIAGFLAVPAAYAQDASGDAEAGEKVFNKCKSCHMIVSADGEEIVKGGRTGPNLWGVVGRSAGSYEDFRYGDDIVKAGEEGLDWNEEEFVAYVQDPREYLKTFLDDSKAKSKMSFKLRDEEEAANVWAYLASVSPAPEMEGDATN
jgi:cytochrome c